MCAVDGYSGMIVGFTTFPVKNYISTSTGLMHCMHSLLLLKCWNYRTVVMQYGLWDQIRTDQGKEWNLLLFINELLSPMRTDCTKPPHLQSSSKQPYAFSLLTA